MPVDIIWADPVPHDLPPYILTPERLAEAFAAPLPPHFPQPNFDPIAHMEGVIAERDEQIAMLYREAQAWKTQLEAALAKLDEHGITL